MVTEKDIMNMGRKIKRSNNPKTLARYQAQIDAWIAELAQDQARTQADREEEVGDLLFVVANLARHLKVDPEAALRAANNKFERRFHYIEQTLRDTGRPIENCSLEELDALWGEAKKLEKQPPGC